jgi:predicted metal-dependent hydrolase
VAFDYTVKFSSRKTLGIEITKDLQILVRAPHRTSKQQIARLVADNSAWIADHLEKQNRRNAARVEPTEEEQAALRALAKAVLPARVAHFSARMGLVPAAVTITSAATRFGSCSGSNRLSFSWRLMQYPDAAVDYVVVHELAHIVHKNHGKDFYALIERYLPDYKARKKLLKR